MNFITAGKSGTERIFNAISSIRRAPNDLKLKAMLEFGSKALLGSAVIYGIATVAFAMMAVSAGSFGYLAVGGVFAFIALDIASLSKNFGAAAKIDTIYLRINGVPGILKHKLEEALTRGTFGFNKVIELFVHHADIYLRRSC